MFATIEYIILGWFMIGAILPRLRDMGISPWVTLGYLVPCLGWALPIVLLAGPTEWANTSRLDGPENESTDPLPAPPKQKPSGMPQLLAGALAVAGLALMLGGFWQSMFDSLAFGPDGDLRKDGIFSALAPVFMQLKMFVALGGFYGLPLLLAGLGMLSWLGVGRSGFLSDQKHASTRACLVLALGAHLLVIAFSCQFFTIKAGTPIRPMGWSMLVFLIALGSLATVLPLGIRGIKKERHRILGAIGCLLALTPLPLAMIMLRCAQKICGFVLED